MSPIQFKSNSFLDAIIYSGVKDEEVIKLAEEKEGKTQQVAQSTFAKYKDQLYLKYNQFLNNVEENLGEFNNPAIPFEVRHKVAEKLLFLANVSEEKNTNLLTKFFQKIKQFVNSHGFQAKSERGIELAARIETINFELVKSQLKAIFSGISPGDPREAIGDLSKEINRLTDKQFKEILDEFVFQETDDPHQNKCKLLLYSHLDYAKQKVFNEALLSRSYWDEQAAEMITYGMNGASQEANDFISNELIAAVERKMQNPGQRSPRFMQFFDVVLVKMIKNYLKEGKFDEIRNLLNRDEVKKNNIYNSPQLKIEDRQILKEHGLMD